MCDRSWHVVVGVVDIVAVAEFIESVTYKTLLGGQLDSSGSIHAPEVRVVIPSLERVG